MKRIVLAIAAVLLFTAPALAQRTQLTAATTLYFDPSGSDTNPGALALPFKTLQRCVNVVNFALDLAGNPVTCQSISSTATYTNGGFLTWYLPLGADGMCPVTIDGNGSTFTGNQDLIPIFAIGGSGTPGVLGGPPLLGLGTAKFCMRRMTLTGTNGANGMFANGGSFTILDGVNFGTLAPDANGNPTYHMLAEGAGAYFIVAYLGSYSISGNASTHCAAWQFAVCVIQETAITVSNTPTFNKGFLDLEWQGQAQYGSNTFTGTAIHGVPYFINGDSVLAGSSGPSQVPGNLAPVCLSGMISAGGDASYNCSNSWTPTVIGSSGGSWTLSLADGSYENIHGQITARFSVITTSKSGTPSGNLEIGGLPFVGGGLQPNDNGGCTFSVFTGLGLDSGYTALGGYVSPGQSVVWITENGSGQPFAQVSAATAPASMAFVGTCTYHL